MDIVWVFVRTSASGSMVSMRVEVLLLVEADGVLGLVKQAVVGGAVLLAGSLVGERLAGGLLAVRDDVTVKEVSDC